MTDLELEAQYFKDSLLLIEKDIAVRVESNNDIDFWHFAFQIAVPSMRTEFYPQSSSGTKGKSGVMLLKEFADKELVLSVDSDYDYLLQNTDLQGSYIFQTYTYAIENYWSFAEGLKNMLEKTTNTEGGIDVDFITFFTNYSDVIYDWLLYSLYSESIGDGLLSRRKCGENIGINKDLPVDEALIELKARLENLSQPFEDQYQENPNFKIFTQRLSELGLNKSNAYLFVRGHDLFDRTTMPLIKIIGDKIVQERLETLKIAGNTKELTVYLKYLKQNTYESNLKYHNKTYQEHFLFQKLISDIKTRFDTPSV